MATLSSGYIAIAEKIIPDTAPEAPIAEYHGWFL